jgi:ribosomal protein S18 acetylase RimI-like enzyme
MIKELTWDSEFFGYKIGEWVVNDDLQADPTGFDLVYVKSSDPVAPQLDGFHLAFSETRVIFSKQWTGNEIDQNIRSVSELDDINLLYEFAYECGKYSRFKLDERFGIDKFKKLYRAWMDKSLTHHMADDVFVFLEKNVIAGFGAYKIHEGYGDMTLMAVAPDQQGKGIGKKLLTHAANAMVSKGITEMRIPTQLENDAACAVYRKLGYKIVETTYLKHYWKINDTL